MFPQEEKLKSSRKPAKGSKDKEKNRLSDSVAAEEGQEIGRGTPLPEGKLRSVDGGSKSGKKRKRKVLSTETDVNEGGGVEKKGKERLLEATGEGGEGEEADGSSASGEVTRVGEEQVVNRMSVQEEGNPETDIELKSGHRKNKKKERLLREAAKADKRGVCYLSQIPRGMDHSTLRQILSQYGEIQRIYLAPKGSSADGAARINSKRADRFRQQSFSEGWVEFSNKHVAKRVANMLNGEQIGGRKRSPFYFVLWNIKYLSKFKWDDLTEEIAYKKAVREQKLALELSAAKRDRDIHLAKFDKSQALSFIEERRQKKQKLQQESGEPSVTQQAQKVIRYFHQHKPVADEAERSRQPLSRDILAGVFGGS